MSDFLLDLIKAYSPTGSEEKAVKVLYNYALSLGFSNVIIDDVGNLIAEIGYGNKSIALIGHIDTVPGELPVQFDGYKVTGRGAVDAKGPLVAMFVGASLTKSIINLEKYKVYAIAVVGEEGDSRGAKRLIEKGFKADGIIIGEPSNNTIVLGYRGSLKVDIICSSSPSHTSSPPVEASACEKLIDIWLKIKSEYNAFRATGNSASLLHLCCGERSRFNVYPIHGSMLIDVRVSINSSIDEAKNEIMNIVGKYSGCVARILDYTQPIKVSINSSIVRAVVRAMLRNGGRPRFSYKLGTSDMNILAICSNNNIVAYGPGKSELSHTEREEIAIDDVLYGINIYRDAVTEFFSIS